MKARALILALLPAACFTDFDDNATPARADIERLEQAVSRHACVGDLELWERNYRYSRKTGLFTSHSLNPDLDVVEFHFRRAGSVTISPGRKVMAHAPGGDWPDSSPIQSVDGKFALSSGALSLAPCEPVETR